MPVGIPIPADIYAPLFGSGADGNVTISSGTAVLTRDMAYNNLTINGTGKLVMSGYRITVAGILDISAAGAGAISWQSGSTKNGSVGNRPGGGSGGYNAYSLRVIAPGAAGGNGGSGATGNGSNGTSGSSATLVYSGTGGAGGSAGAGSSGSAGSGAAGGPVVIQQALPIPTENPFFNVYNSGFQVYLGGTGGGGGGGGGGDGSNAGAGGGGGGVGGDNVLLLAYQINRGASTAAGAIYAKGGSGGAGGSPTAGNAGGGGGGAGGGGGRVWICCHGLIGVSNSSIVDISGGNGGNGGAGFGSGASGNGGNAGLGGGFEIIILGAKTYTVTAPGTTVASAPSGATAGVATTLQVGF